MSCQWQMSARVTVWKYMRVALAYVLWGTSRSIIYIALLRQRSPCTYCWHHCTLLPCWIENNRCVAFVNIARVSMTFVTKINHTWRRLIYVKRTMQFIANKPNVQPGHCNRWIIYSRTIFVACALKTLWIWKWPFGYFLCLKNAENAEKFRRSELIFYLVRRQETGCKRFFTATTVWHIIMQILKQVLDVHAYRITMKTECMHPSIYASGVPEIWMATIHSRLSNREQEVNAVLSVGSS